eukprot:1851793-Rhodomonas_salina.2
MADGTASHAELHGIAPYVSTTQTKRIASGKADSGADPRFVLQNLAPGLLLQTPCGLAATRIPSRQHRASHSPRGCTLVRADLVGNDGEVEEVCEAALALEEAH